MTTRFDRIVREPLVMGGQARIRTTGIMVDTIVRQTLKGASLDDLLQEYPELEAADVHQALAYVVLQRQELAHKIVDDLSNPLSIIVGYAEMLKLDLEEGLLDQGSIETAIDAFQLSTNRLANVSEWFRELFTTHIPEEKSFSKFHLDEQILQHVADAPQNLPPISLRSVSELTRAVGILRLTHFGSLHDDGVLSIQQQGQYLIFQIRRNTIVTGNMAKVILDPYSEFSLANMLLYLNGGELNMHQELDHILFEFALPIWDEDKN